MVSNMAFKSQQAEVAQNNGAAGSKLLLEGAKAKKVGWGTEVRAGGTVTSDPNYMKSGSKGFGI